MSLFIFNYRNFASTTRESCNNNSCDIYHGQRMCEFQMYSSIFPHKTRSVFGALCGLLPSSQFPKCPSVAYIGNCSTQSHWNKVTILCSFQSKGVLRRLSMMPPLHNNTARTGTSHGQAHPWREVYRTSPRHMHSNILSYIHVHTSYNLLCACESLLQLIVDV